MSRQKGVTPRAAYGAKPQAAAVSSVTGRSSSPPPLLSVFLTTSRFFLCSARISGAALRPTARRRMSYSGGRRYDSQPRSQSVMIICRPGARPGLTYHARKGGFKQGDHVMRNRIAENVSRRRGLGGRRRVASAAVPVLAEPREEQPVIIQLKAAPATAPPTTQRAGGWWTNSAGRGNPVRRWAVILG